MARSSARLEKHGLPKFPASDLVGWISESEKAAMARRGPGSWSMGPTTRVGDWSFWRLEQSVTPSVVVDAPGVRDAVIDGRTGVAGGRCPTPRVPTPLVKAWIELSSDGVATADMLGAAALEPRLRIQLGPDGRFLGGGGRRGLLPTRSMARSHERSTSDCASHRHRWPAVP